MKNNLNKDINKNYCANTLSFTDKEVDYKPAIILIYKVLQEQSKE